MKQPKQKSIERRSRQPRNLSPSRLPERSQFARDRALHVLSAMRRDSSLSLTRAAKFQGIKPATVKKYFPSALTVSNGRFRATTRDRYPATLYIPDSQGNPIPVKTRSSKERRELSNYLRDLGRYLRGDRNALARWHGTTFAGIELVTDARTIKLIEPALSDFSIYRTLNGGGI
jgi:hypothetical protein